MTEVTDHPSPARDSILDQPHQPPDSDWWYVRAYPGSGALMDAACDVLVPWLREAAASENADRWFFLRYIDMVGPHLRLRIRCAPDGVDRLHSRMPELWLALDKIPPDARGEPLIANGLFGDASGAVRVAPGLYAPEMHKYGGPAGVEAAERLFTASARWYADNLPHRSPRRFRRAALATTLMRELVTTALPPEDWKEFWLRHRRQWGWQLVMSQGKAAVPDLVSETVTGVREVVADVDVAAVRTHVASVVATFEEVTRSNSGVDRLDLLLNYLHMDINRWGFVPAEEALLGMVTTSMR
ncbi:thiopeptide-type bacteriocin biosynthesis protein [Spiractinospora alimapuensis]|uniref:thiopeptide-type bacteriocin biosynthesis protein n=1 Tax=Spiractinospora alimapuensis TaxID=2820884 RepID=UPI001F37685F|nr:thiopeptide-type bacteriocin biosynthesis protein [Spiractinospora alimapuensis]QVQ50248.1 thiopeptide-type bacteriocin biosynthesis protein [Spiractinospora alimapuensis]